MRKLVCFGDSITARHEGYKDPILTTKLFNKLKEFEIINAGLSGHNTCHGLERLEKDVIIYNPDLVTVLFGANDAAFHKMVDIELFRKNITKMVEQIGPKKTILITPAPVDESVQFARTNKVLGEYAASVKQISENMGTHIIDFHNSLLQIENFQRILKGKKNDGLHFGEEGYNILVELISQKVKELVN